MKQLLTLALAMMASTLVLAETKETKIYSTDFQEWADASSSTTAATKTVSTVSGDLTLTWAETQIASTGTNSKFTNAEVITTGYAMAAKTATPYIETSAIANVTTVTYVHAATGGSRGWGLKVKGDGDSDWVTVQSEPCAQAGTEVTVSVNRTNVQLHWYNLNASQNAYMTSFTIKGMADVSDYVEEYKVTYFDQNDQQLGEETLKEGDKLSFKYGASDLQIPEGYAFRGWAKADGTKMQEGATVATDLKLFALVTPIEVAKVGTHYSYDLTKTSFYQEDHECFTSVGKGKWHDAQHGWEFSSGDKIQLTVAGNAYIQLGLCEYSNSGAVSIKAQKSGKEVATFEGKQEACTTTSIYYEGEADVLEVAFAAKNYISKVNIYNVKDRVEKSENGYYIVPAGDASSLMMVLQQLQDGDKIYLPNGTYDLGEVVLSTIAANNVSVIGESMEGTVIKNAPDASTESIDRTATLVLTGKNTYLQDLTLQNALDYYKANNGRAVALWDKGDNTICKNVRLLSYQDTYYSNKPGQVLYWEGGEIHGTVDYICGCGTVYFNGVELFNEKRNSTGGGSDCITASNAQSAKGDKGYVFESCTIKSECPLVSLSRAWNNEPQVVYLNTVMDESAGKFSLEGSGIKRWTVKGMNNCDPVVFGEYNSVDTKGNVVSPASNIVKFESASNPELETILTKAEAEKYSYANVLGAWDPAVTAAQIAVTEATIEGNTLSWKAAEGATAYLVSCDGTTVILDAKTTSLSVGDGVKTATVRAANGRGGFGEACTAVKNSSDAIHSTLDNNHSTTLPLFTLSGQKASNNAHGLLVSQGVKMMRK